MSAGARHLTYYACAGLFAALAMALLAACAAEPKPPSAPLPALQPASEVGAVSTAPASLAAPVAPLASAESPAPVRSEPTQRFQLTSPGAQSPDGAAPTTVVEYVAERPGGEARAGSCWTNSLAVPSRDAWRCSVGSQVLDPCFALESGEVVCNPNPLTGYAGVLVKLREPLPRPDLIVERASPAWLLQLEDGTVCNLAAGATGLVGDKRISYVCSAATPKETERVVILGDLRPGTVWTAEEATLALREGKFVLTTSSTVTLRAVVRGPAALVPYACGRLADSMAEVLGADVRRSEAPFVDPATGERGTGCQATAARIALDSARPPADLVGKMLAVQGWREDARYRVANASRSALAFRKGSALCLVSVGPEPAAETGRAANQAGPAVPRAAPQQHAVTLSCARDRSVAAAPEPGPPEPERILFEPDTTAGSLRRPIATGEVQEYVLRAFAGQTMIVDVRSPSGDVFLTVYGRSDGAALVRPTASARRWQGKLPATQDYVVRATARGEATDLELRVVIPVAIGPPETGRPAVAKGTLAPGQSAHYALSGRVDQRVAVVVTSPDRAAYLTVAGVEDGEPLVSAVSRTASWVGKFPRTQDYVVEVISDGASASYTLAVTVQ